MPLATSGKNDMLTGLSSGALALSLHTGAPGTTGANEVTGGTPAYARSTIVWGAPAGGTLSTSVSPAAQNVPAGTTVRYVGLWSALSGGTFKGSFPAGGSTGTPFTAKAATDILESESHGLVDGDQVVIIDTTGAVIPTGLLEETTYFVIASTASTLKLSLTSGGAAVDITADGAGFVAKMVAETFAAAGTYQASSLTIDAGK